MTEHPIRVDTGGGREEIRMVDLPSNSERSKEQARQARKKQAPPVEKVVTGDVVQRPPNVWRRVRSSIVAESVGETVFQYVILDVVIPAAKNMLLDAVNQGLERYLFGAIRLRSAADRPGGVISYNKVRRTQQAEPTYNSISQTGRASHDFQEVILRSRGDAEDVLDRLRDLISQYDVATVADFYDLVGISSDFPDDTWGWYDLRSAAIRHVRGGYLISLPRTRPIDK